MSDFGTTENVSVLDTPNDKLVKEYTQKFEACKASRQRVEKDWFMNMSFYFGRQYVTWNRSVTSDNWTLGTQRVPAWRVRHTANKIRPIIRKEITKLSKEVPQFFVVPASSDDTDIAAARAAEAIAESIIYSTSFNRKRRQATWWATVTGIGYTKTWWDENESDSDGNRGIIRIDSVSPFHIWVPNLENPEIEEQPYIFHAVAMSPEDVKNLYGVALEPNAVTSQTEQRFRSGLGISDKDKKLDAVQVIEVWIKPNHRFPNGAMFTMGGGKLLYKQDSPKEFDDAGNEKTFDGLDSDSFGGREPVSSWPYTHRKYPFTKIDHIPSGKYYGDSVISDLLPLQKEYNRSRSQGMEARNLTSKPQWTVPKGSIDVKKMTAQPGLVIEYTPGFDRPMPINNPDLPPYVMQMEDRTLRDIDFTASQFEVSQGRTPPGIEAASAIAYLQEENDTVLGHTVASLEEAVADIGMKALNLAHTYWEDGRMIKVVSGSNAFEAMMFKKETTPTVVDLRVEAGSMAPRSKAAKQALITELLKMGAIPQMEALKYLEQSETNRLYADLQVDSRQAQRENYRLKQGEQLTINPFDNHVAHVIAHERFMKGQEFEMLDDQIKQVFLQHHSLHLQQYGQETKDALEDDGTTEPGRDATGGSTQQ